MNDESNVVTFERSRRRPDPARVREFAVTARRLQAERQSSSELVERLLRTTPRNEWPRLAEEPSMRNSGALEKLAKEISSRLEKNPQEALALSNLATAIAETLAFDAYPAIVLAQIRAQAWKDRGQALRYLARYREALEALDRAEALLVNFGSLMHDLAVVMYVRAITLQESGEFDESRSLLNESGLIFKEHGDVRRFMYCAVAEGMLEFRLGKLLAARQAFTELLGTARSIQDRETEARLHNNIGQCASRLGELENATIHLTHAMTLFDSLGLETDVLRAEQAAALVTLRKGDIRRGLAELREARSGFLSHGMIEEAGLCGLDIVGALVEEDKAAEAVELAASIVEEFSDAGLNRRAVTAVEYLREAIRARRATRATVTSIADYLGALQRNPNLEFVATA
ncbi:MAG TPA: hypothetical protein VF618_10375 [Thermoanaerobaculia bacterium]